MVDTGNTGGSKSISIFGSDINCGSIKDHSSPEAGAKDNSEDTVASDDEETEVVVIDDNYVPQSQNLMLAFPSHTE